MKRFGFAFENLGPTPRRDEINDELLALANVTSRDHDRPIPKGVGVAEAIGKRLPVLPRHDMLRDTRRPGRANVALYVRADLAHDHEWIDLDETWPRTEHPGTHPPRSILVAQVEDWRVIVAHAPPLGRRTGDARAEWLAAMVDAILDTPDDRTPVLALTDPNGLGPALLLGPGMVTGGTPVEAAHGRRVILDHAQAVESVNGVRMRTDHGRALIGHARRRAI